MFSICFSYICCMFFIVIIIIILNIYRALFIEIQHNGCIIYLNIYNIDIIILYDLYLFHKKTSNVYKEGTTLKQRAYNEIYGCFFVCNCLFTCCQQIILIWIFLIAREYFSNESSFFSSYC